jgi:HD-GYP domain-containing protein (c-di-GMP phosphodiesterase class II)
MEGFVHALADTVDARDPYTAGHQHRVSKIACAIAEEMNLSNETVAGIRMAGEIHDLGKMSIPAEVLMKPGRLLEVEFNYIKIHPQKGYDILKGMEFPWPVARIVLEHHERMDGSGYPNGLSGEDILPEARIVAIADVVEAMASHRPYRPALGIEVALEEIENNSGTLYDSDFASACLRLFREKKFTFNNKDR